MWQNKSESLYQKFVFKDFDEAFNFMQEVAARAKAQDHHPKWQNNWNEVEIWLSTHSEKTITDKDRKLAKSIDLIYDRYMKPKKEVKISESKLYTDGGSRGNPGPSAGAFVICKLDDTVVEKSGVYLGITTNNQAEYKALLAGLRRAAELGVKTLQVYMDSELIVKQLNGLYKVKNQDIMPLYKEAKDILDTFASTSVTHVPRALNSVADKEVNHILDDQKN